MGKEYGILWIRMTKKEQRNFNMKIIKNVWCILSVQTFFISEVTENLRQNCRIVNLAKEN